MPRTRRQSKKLSKPETPNESSENEDPSFAAVAYESIYPSLHDLADSLESDSSSVIGKTTKNSPKRNHIIETTSSDSANDSISDHEQIKSFTSFKSLDNSFADHNKSTDRPSQTRAHSDEAKASSFNNSTILYLCVFILLIAVLIQVIPNKIDDNPAKKTKLTPVESFYNQISKCQNTSKVQNKRLWRNLKSYKNHVSDINPKQPAVLMFISMPQASEEMKTIAKLAASAYSYKCNKPYHAVDAGEYRDQNWEIAKENLDKDISERFHKDGACALIVNNFERLPPASTELFYGYCENDNAPHKNAMVIFTVEIDYDWAGEHKDELTNFQTDHKVWDRVIDSYLTYILSKDTSGKINENVIGGLLSRITPVVSWVIPENTLTC